MSEQTELQKALGHGQLKAHRGPRGVQAAKYSGGLIHGWRIRDRQRRRWNGGDANSVSAECANWAAMDANVGWARLVRVECRAEHPSHWHERRHPVRRTHVP